MKKTMCMLLVVLMALTMGMCALAEDSDAAYVQDKGTLVVGMTLFAPMNYYDTQSGAFVGFDTELATAVCERLGLEVEFVEINWDSKEIELNAKNIDCIWNGLSMTDARAQTIRFSMPYMHNEQVFVVKSESGYVTTQDLAGKALGVQAASSAVEALDAAADFRATLASVTEYDMNTELLAALDAGDVDVALMDVTMAGHYMATQDVAFHVLEEALAPELYAVGFRKADVALTEAVNDALATLAFNGVLEEIATDWFTDDITIVAEQVALSEEE